MALEWGANVDIVQLLTEGDADPELAQCLSEFLAPCGGEGAPGGVGAGSRGRTTVSGLSGAGSRGSGGAAAAAGADGVGHWLATDWEWDGVAMRATRRTPSAALSAAAAAAKPVPPVPAAEATAQQQKSSLTKGHRPPNRRVFSTCRGCAARETTESRFKWNRYNVCDVCSSGQAVDMVSGGGTVRFCQRCHKLVPVDEFGEARRSCRPCLEHLSAKRRRTPKQRSNEPEPLNPPSAPTASSSANGAPGAPAPTHSGYADAESTPRDEPTSAMPGSELIRSGLQLVTQGIALHAQAEATAMDGVQVKVESITPAALPENLMPTMMTVIPARGPAERELHALMRPGCVSLTVCGVEDPASPEQIVERLAQTGAALWKRCQVTVGVGSTIATNELLSSHEVSEAPVVQWVHPAVAQPGEVIRLRVCGRFLAGSTLSLRWGKHSLEVPLPPLLPTDDFGSELALVRLQLPPALNGVVAVQAVAGATASAALPLPVHNEPAVREEMRMLVENADATATPPSRTVRGMIFLLGRALGRDGLDVHLRKGLELTLGTAGYPNVAGALRRRGVRDHVLLALILQVVTLPLHIYKTVLWHPPTDEELVSPYIYVVLRFLVAIPALYMAYYHPERFERHRFMIGVLNACTLFIGHLPSVIQTQFVLKPRRIVLSLTLLPVVIAVFALGQTHRRFYAGMGATTAFMCVIGTAALATGTFRLAVYLSLALEYGLIIPALLVVLPRFFSVGDALSDLSRPSASEASKRA